MNKVQAKDRIHRLKKTIDRHRYLYHVLDRQEISDEALDSLKHELSLLEARYPDLVTRDSPTQRVGGEPLDRFEKVEHSVPMLSIEDIFSEKELQDWEEYVKRLLGGQWEYFAELKVDGLAIALRYQHGVLVSGATRGNGRVGEDVTQNIKTIESIPLKLQNPKHEIRNPKQILNNKFKIPNGFEFRISNFEFPPALLEVRGEVYIEKRDFEKFNVERTKQGEQQFANPRNLAAGSIRQLDPKLAASRPLKFIAYDMVTDANQRLHSEEHEMLRAIGFKTDRTAKVCANIQEVCEHWKDMEKKREALPFQVDGIVVNINDNAAFEKLGVAGKSPRAIRAMKFVGKQATTKIADVKFQVGRTGAVTPVAVLEPVQLYGVTVSHATLHNEDEIKKLAVKIGDTVVVERAGDVIPAVVKVLPELRDGKEKSFRMPSQCPSCAARLTRPEGEAIWRCRNPNCRAQQREFLYHFVSKKAFDIRGLGPKIIDRLVEEHLISDPSDIFELQAGDLAPLERFAEKSASNIISAIERSKRIPLSRFLYSLGIRHAGEETAIDLSEHFGSVEKLQRATKEELESVRGVGSVVAESIESWFRSKTNQKLIEVLVKAGVTIENPQPMPKGKKLKRLVFVLTGSLTAISREEAKEKIRLLGGEVSDSVSRATAYLVVGEKPGSKLNKAQRLGVKTIGEQEFLSLLQ